VNVSYTAPTLNNTTLYVQFSPTASPAAYSGNITNAGGGATTKNVAVTGTSIITYCAAGATTCDEYIYQVQVGSINNLTACTAGGYADYTGQSTNMTVGIGYPISVTNGLAYTGDQCGVWVDWNQDGDFADANETITVGGGVAVFSGTLTPPTGATLGGTRLRIRIMYTGTLDPCGTATYGEVEDYSINVQSVPPVDLALTNFYQTSGNKSLTIESNLLMNNYGADKVSGMNLIFGILTEDGTGEQSSIINNTVILPDYSYKENGSKYPFINIGMEATISNYGLNAASFDLDWTVGGVSQSTYNGPSVPSGSTDYASLSYTPTGRGTFITTGTVSTIGDADPGNNTYSFRTRVYPDVYTRTIYDRGDNVVDTYVGYGDLAIPMKAGVRYTALEDTKLAGVDFIYRTEDVTSGTILIQIRAAGAGTGAPGAVLYTQAYNSADYLPNGLVGEYITFAFGDDAPIIASGSDYWITIKMPVGILYPSGVHNDGFATGRSFYEGTGDTTVWNPLVITSERAWIMRSINIAVNNSWTGTISTDWNDPGNWNAGVPKGYSKATIPSSPANQPHITADQSSPAQCDNLIIENGAVVTIDADKGLTVNGTLTNNSGESGLVIKSDASGTGSLISATTGVDAKVERFLTNMKWHFIGMPVESGVAGVFHLPAGHADIYLKTHIESTNTWSPFIVPVATPLVQGRGYECWVGDPTVPANQMDETVVFPGKLGAGNYTTGSGSFYPLEYTAGHGLNLICNPYPSALQANIHTWANTNIAPKVYVWDPIYGNYRYWNGTTGTPAPYAGYGTLTGGVIPEMQSFFVEATGASPSLTIPQSDRIHSSQVYYKDSGIPLNTLRIDVAGNGFEDAMFINFNEFSTEGYDTDFDVEKLYGLNEAPQLYSIIAGKNLSINALPELNENLIIPVGFECAETSDFTVQATGLDGFEENVNVYLEDLLSGTVQNLNENPIYDFTGGNSEDPMRFRLHFDNLTVAEELVSNPVRIYSNQNMVFIHDLKPGNVMVNIYDMMGRQIEEMQTTSARVICMQVNTQAGFYIVKVQTGDQFYTKKVYIK
jgi:hypothetical protein